MIFLKVNIDNFYMFSNTTLDLTYKKSVSNSTVDFEFLKDFEKIKFKRVCIVSGANASGKTNLGRLLNSVNAFLVGRDVQYIEEYIRNKKKPASFYVEFVDSKM